ncbi:MAG: phosphoenolpyruvate synthase [Gammaproteobacteria bacterium]|nr:MAG: phosphoenolpyruvate synthase [Gammaproteobacteria bacterium]
MTEEYIIWFDHLGMGDVARVGGKNASLGEMITNLSGAGVRVPGGFATTAAAYREFLRVNGLDRRIAERLEGLDVSDVGVLQRAGAEVRGWILEAPLPPALDAGIRENYRRLGSDADPEPAVAVRSSATAEDLPEASFAGQQETFLNIRGEEAVVRAVHEVYASLYNDRAISYRAHHGFDQLAVALSAGIQRMVRSDLAASGVLFTLDTESGFRDVVFVTASWGLGEMVVQGAVNPDEFYLYKPNLDAGRPAVLQRHLGAKAIRMVLGDGPDNPVRTEEVPEAERMRFCLSDAEVEELGRHALAIERHYGRPMDVEWAKDGLDGQIYILQARPETVESRKGNVVERYHLKERGKVLTKGRSIGNRIGAGKARLIASSADMERLAEGEVLVTDMTDPDWEPVMKRAAAIVTNRGGRTCHAAIVARELGIPAVVGTGDATEAIGEGQEVTVSCAEGETGYVYEGLLDYECRRLSTEELPVLPVKIMMNVGNPGRAFHFSALPAHGVGLARLEFVINNMIGIHPRALLEYERQPAGLKAEIDRRIAGYPGPVEFYVERLAEGIAMLGAAFAPKPVIVRLSDFKSNEYRNLLGGDRYEPEEENPMIGFRGASRYVSEAFRDCFALECRAVRKVREEMGLTNVEVMIPFVRTPAEAEEVIGVLKENGLERGREGLRLIMMCEIPSNPLEAEAFLEHFDGFSIGSNDLTQLTLGLDRDSALVAHRFDERAPAVKALIHMAIQACRQRGRYIGICGQAPSDYPDFASWLMEEGIESISLNPDTVIDTWLYLAGEGQE